MSLSAAPSYSFREKFVDPDFRNEPKTKVFCFVCQKDIRTRVRYLGHAAFGCVVVVHPDDREIADRELPAEDNNGMLPVGPDCAKRIGFEWFVLPEEESGT